MIVGFTGSREGLSYTQMMQLEEVVRGLSPDNGIHGDCIGSDADFHYICKTVLRIPIIIRPCNLNEQRAFCRGAVIVHPAKAPIERNHDIVNECNILIACPKEESEILRSGTWATVRYARKIGKKVIMIGKEAK